MKRKPKGAPPGSFWLAPISALCIAGALSLAVFYHGPQLPLLAGAQALLVIWLALSLAGSYSAGIRLPLTPLSISLTLFWTWLGVSLLWSAVPATSILNFWWVGSLALVFWAYTLTPHRDQVWAYSSRFALLGALALCVHALVQLFVFQQPPRATFINIHSFAALMMLIALPVAGYFLRALSAGPTQRRDAVILGASLFVLCFTIATTQGRGTTLSMLAGMALLAALAAPLAGRRPVLALVGIVAGSYLAANLILTGGLYDRMSTLVDPSSAGTPRFLIWEGSWRMLMEHPWFGIGLGLYYLAWPPYRHPEDSSLGFFVHNDYLQIWIEVGLPGLLLLLAVFAAVLLMLVRALRGTRLDTATKLETIGLVTGLFAVAAHSFLDFNFYILPISIVAGLLLGRLHACTTDAVRAVVLRPERVLQERAYRLVLVLLLLFPLVYFVALGVSDFMYKRGFELAARGQLVESDHAFGWAEVLNPPDDKVWVMHADLYRHVISRLPQSEEADKRTFYNEAMEMLDRAESLNPYRGLVHSVRAKLYQENPELAGPEGRARAESLYKTALALDPRAFLTRMEYARLLVNAGQPETGYRLLEAGMHYWYPTASFVLPYYYFTASLARQLGEVARAEEIDTQMRALSASLARMAPSRPVAIEGDLTVTTAGSS